MKVGRLKATLTRLSLKIQVFLGGKNRKEKDVCVSLFSFDTQSCLCAVAPRLSSNGTSLMAELQAGLPLLVLPVKSALHLAVH